ncbi:hypothetical protein VDG1235_4099 [Verrucomicrobiia bacterium DG1235]|nr:hypothetical protein VDG1235_4099 [Verrucomicrobiae bacterium DG1235]
MLILAGLATSVAEILEMIKEIRQNKTYLVIRDSPARIHNGYILGCHSY